MKMRVIKFRGKTTYGKWVYGDLFHVGDKSYILDETAIFERDYYNDVVLRDTHYEEVIPETVGQFVGLLDKNGKEIYEGDIVLHDALPGAKNGLPIVWEGCGFTVKGKLKSDDIHLGKYSGPNIEVVDNPELLNAEDNK